MGESFTKLKKQYVQSAIIKSVICGLSFGLLVTGIVLLSLKLAKVEINPAFYVLICAGCALAAGGAAFWLLRPTDRKIAKKLDKEYGLNERIQTMVEFSQTEGDVVGLQREDAEVKLSSLPKKKPSFSKLWQYVAVPVVAVAMLFTAVFIPGKGAQADDDPRFELKNVQAIALQQLIDDVKKSDLDQTLSSQTVIVLEGLLDGLEEAKLDSVMRRSVIAAVSLIDGIFENANSYLKISTELSKAERSKDFGTAIVKAVVSYRSPVKIKTLEKVTENAAKGDENISAALDEFISKLAEKWGELRGMDLNADLQQFLTSFNACLTGTGYDESDALYKALDEFSSSLIGISNNILGGGYNSNELQRQVTNACAQVTRSCTAALFEQMYNCMMDEFVREKLAEIFGLKSTDLPSYIQIPPEVPGVDEPPPSGNDPDKETEGGIGPGDPKYGSDAIIYYPDREEHIKYGDVFNKYYAEAEERLNSGEISDELIKIISEYFKNLDIVNKTEK